jgi:hypothetical protein
LFRISAANTTPAFNRRAEVAKSALTELTDHIDSIRQEAFEEGYAAAMRAVAEFTASGTTKPKATTAQRISVKATSAKSDTTTPAASRRQERARTTPAVRVTKSRGENSRHVAEAMTTLPNHSGPAAAIRKALAEKGINMPFTSIRHALGQLQARGEVSVSGKTWTYTAPGP